MEMEKNNFQKLEELNEAKFEAASEAIKNNVSSRKGSWSLIGDLIELYIPKIFSTLIGSNEPLTKSGIEKLPLENDI